MYFNFFNRYLYHLKLSYICNLVKKSIQKCMNLVMPIVGSGATYYARYYVSYSSRDAT